MVPQNTEPRRSLGAPVSLLFSQVEDRSQWVPEPMKGSFEPYPYGPLPEAQVAFSMRL